MPGQVLNLQATPKGAPILSIYNTGYYKRLALILVRDKLNFKQVDIKTDSRLKDKMKKITMLTI